MAIVTVALYGGLGNQMFQYAMGRALASRTGATLQLDLFGFDFDAVYQRKFDLAHFGITNTAAFIRCPFRFRISRFFRRSAELFPPVSRMFPPTTMVELPKQVDPPRLMLKRDHNLYVMGYWQDERYFRDSRDTLLREFRLRSVLSVKNQEVERQIAACLNPVAVHIRRMHGIGIQPRRLDPKRDAYVLPLAYYRNAIAELQRRVGPAELFIFSDNPDWVQQNVRFPGKVCFLENGRGPDYEDVQLMRLCRHHIIANSSFSWWGAWLAKTEGQVVIAPKQAIKHLPRVPDSWVRVGW